ncbi:MAG: DUF4931 domain-containing protein, partial [Nanoarchaeota archaeon]
MTELRKDYILDRWVILAPSRKKRPRDFVRQTAAVSTNLCVFCKGNEKLTPPEIGRVSAKDSSGRWLMRWFPNLFPAVAEEGQKEVRTDNTFYTFAAAYGSHDVVVETPQHERQLWDFASTELEQLLKVYRERISALERKGGKYVVVFKNHGNEAGTSLVHSHTQIASINILPQLIIEEATAIKNH